MDPHSELKLHRICLLQLVWESSTMTQILGPRTPLLLWRCIPLAITISIAVSGAHCNFVPGHQVAGEPGCDALELIICRPAKGSRQNLSSCRPELSHLGWLAAYQDAQPFTRPSLANGSVQRTRCCLQVRLCCVSLVISSVKTSGDWPNALQVYVEGPKLSTALYQQHP